ncbi:MAG: methyltransferase [Desulfobacteraceae bacterium]|jgi:predicted nicotinamide N-methyase
MEQFERTYDTEIFPVQIGKVSLRFHKPKSLDRFINPDDPMKGFPLWAKIWDASAVLTQYIAELEVDARRRILELGSGLGVAGIAAASLGHHITLTEYDTNALEFLKANAELNQCQHIPIHYLDWFQPQLEGSFDLIVGSEIVYQKATVAALGDLFRKYMAPAGQVVLVERVRSTGAVFFEKMADIFHIRAQKRTLQSNTKSETVVLFELRLK